MRPEPNTLRISFLDDDHVVKLARLILSSSGRADVRWLRAFFAPEPIDLPALFALGAGLQQEDGAEIRLVDGDDPQAVAGSTVLMFRRGQVTRAMLDACPDLRLVQRLGEDASFIDLVAARERGIEVSCLPRPSHAHTAEHALLLMLALAKRLLPADRAVRTDVRGCSSSPPADGVAYNWAGISDIGGLFGRTLGVVGLGEIGALVAMRAKAFGMRVVYTNNVPVDPERVRALGAESRSLEELLAESDFVSLHVPGMASNEGLIGAAEIGLMRPGSLLVNTSRGLVVDEDALYEALVEGRIGGAGLDVHRHEPRPASDRFCQLDNVVLTPHISGGSRRDVLEEIAAMFDNVRAVLAGGPALHGRVEPVA